MYKQHNMPMKTREIHNHHMDSTIWNDVKFRDDDIVIATYAKSGTTLVQNIVLQLIFDGDPSVNVIKAPWIDLRFPKPVSEKLEMIEKQTHRRSFKTHLQLDALPFSPIVKYIYIARDGRDMVWSMHNHLFRANDAFYEKVNDPAGLVGPTIDRPGPDIREYFLEWLERDGYPLWPYWENIRTWWAARYLPNVKLLHFNDLKSDLPGSIRAIANFLAIDINESSWDRIVEHCTFDYMKRNASHIMPGADFFFEGGAQAFINKGTNGRWIDTLTEEDNRYYLETAERELGKECAHWLKNGHMHG